MWYKQRRLFVEIFCTSFKDKINPLGFYAYRCKWKSRQDLTANWGKRSRRAPTITYVHNAIVEGKTILVLLPLTGLSRVYWLTEIPKISRLVLFRYDDFYSNVNIRILMQIHDLVYRKREAILFFFERLIVSNA